MMKSTQETSSVSELCVQKFRSPPPKPPRRRNSDHSTNTPTALFNWRKGLDGNCTSTPKGTLNQFSSYKSGSETLPSNWFLGFLNNDQIEHTNECLNRRLGNPDTEFSLDKAYMLSKESYSEKYLLGRNSHNQFENINLSPQCKLFTGCQSSNYEKFHHPKIRSSVKLSNAASQYNTPRSMNNFSRLQFKEENSNLFYSFNDIPFDLKKDIFQSSNSMKIIHRRHHSDPLLSRFNKPLKKVSIKTSSYRSHSFVDTGSPNCCPRITERGVKNQHCLPLPKDPAFLLEEIKVLQEMNDQLWRHLCSAQAKLDRLQNPNVSVKAETIDSPSFAELISSIYYAQKEKDNAMESCLQTTMKERDSAFLELEEIMLVLGRSSGDTDSSDGDKEISNQEIKDLLKEIEVTQNPTKILQHQRMLLTYLYQAREEKHQRLSHNFQMALVEKNAALSMIKHLKNELDLWKHSSDSWHLETKQWESTLLDTLCHVISQRDSALSKVSSLENEMNSVGQLWKIQKSLTGDTLMNSDYGSLQKQDFPTSCLESCKVHCKTAIRNDNESSSDERKSSNFQTSTGLHYDDVEVLKSEVCILNQNLKAETKSRRIAEENCLRLERLVNVLRKKVNGLSVGVHV